MSAVKDGWMIDLMLDDDDGVYETSHVDDDCLDDDSHLHHRHSGP